MSHLMSPVFIFQLEAELNLKLCAERKTMVNSSKNALSKLRIRQPLFRAHMDLLLPRKEFPRWFLHKVWFFWDEPALLPSIHIVQQEQKVYMHTSYICIILGNSKHQGSQQHSTTPQLRPFHPYRLTPSFHLSLPLTMFTTNNSADSLHWPRKAFCHRGKWSCCSTIIQRTRGSPIYHRWSQLLRLTFHLWSEETGIGCNKSMETHFWRSCDVWLAMLNQRCQEKILRWLLRMITDLAVSNALPEMATKAISYSQVLEYVKGLKPNLEIQMPLTQSSMTFWLRRDLMMQSSRCNG